MFSFSLLLCDAFVFQQLLTAQKSTETILSSAYLIKLALKPAADIKCIRNLRRARFRRLWHTQRADPSWGDSEILHLYTAAAANVHRQHGQRDSEKHCLMFVCFVTPSPPPHPPPTCTVCLFICTTFNAFKDRHCKIIIIRVYRE